MRPERLQASMPLNRGMAEWTGLEPATPGVTGRYSNQLNYHSALSLTQVLTKAGMIHETCPFFPVAIEKLRSDGAITPLQLLPCPTRPAAYPAK
jgi:hypothetical protein